MATQAITAIDDVTASRAVAAERVPWTVYAVLFASTSVVTGVMWDISWHRTIGRDTFFTPAHLAIYLGGLVAGLGCGWLALRTTFGGSVEARATSVRFWGFSAPFGAWVCIWGAIAMLTSAPFDDWWHNAYGLDVQIISPPHMVLAAGIGALQCGAMLMALACQNRSTAEASAHVNRLFLFGAGLLLLLAATVVTEYTGRWDMHQSLFYQVSATVFVFFLVSAARASRARWPATTVALVYTAITYAMLLLLPRFSGEPLLGPIYVPVDRFMPPDFPLLLLVPAVAIDLIVRRSAPGRWRDWATAALVATVFLLVFLAVQWPFADFLMSEWARNDLFGSHRMDYGVSPVVQARWYRIRPPDDLARGLPIALGLSLVSARVALWWGTWMTRVRR